jgi:hypothetical protein
LLVWGTVLDLALLYTLATKGLGAFREAAFGSPAEKVVWAWANRLCGLLAVAAWALVLGGRWSSPREGA